MPYRPPPGPGGESGSVRTGGGSHAERRGACRVRAAAPARGRTPPAAAQGGCRRPAGGDPAPRSPRRRRGLGARDGRRHRPVRRDGRPAGVRPGRPAGRDRPADQRGGQERGRQGGDGRSHQGARRERRATEGRGGGRGPRWSAAFRGPHRRGAQHHPGHRRARSSGRPGRARTGGRTPRWCTCSPASGRAPCVPPATRSSSTSVPSSTRYGSGSSTRASTRPPPSPTATGRSRCSTPTNWARRRTACGCWTSSAPGCPSLDRRPSPPWPCGPRPATG